MRILYVANHDQINSNQDEESITWSLEKLGHDVVRIQESRGYKACNVRDVDLVLFHKWSDTQQMRAVKAVNPKALFAFWYFDLVDYPDPTLESRNSNRRNWMASITPLVDIGFCTDGDWVNRDKTGKLVRLLQGADGRIAEAGLPILKNGKDMSLDILFTGIQRGGGQQRVGFVDMMNAVYQSRFRQVQGVYGKDLADLIAGSKIVVAPEGPVTDQYWSNRVYMALGFGAFMLHPHCKTLTDHYEHGREIVYYHDRTELHEFIDHYLKNPAETLPIRQAGLERTLKEHTYLLRCEELIRTVRSRLL